MNAGKVVVKVEEYEQHIPLLLATQPVGSVHSVFHNGVNIRMGEQLFFIGTTRNGQLPFGIHLSQHAVREVLETIHLDSVITWKPDQQRFVIDDGLLTISLVNAVSFNWQIPKHDVQKETQADNLFMLLTSLLNEPRITGLTVNIETFITNYLEKSDTNETTEAHIRKLLLAVQSTDREEIESVLRYFLGRGQGLTPSGDDHLVGLLAIHTATGLLSPEFVNVLKRLVYYEKLTTDIGREYLLYAMQGRFSSDVVKLTSALTEETDIYMLKPLLSELLEMGHSSGIDTVFGMLLGLLALRRRQE